MFSSSDLPQESHTRQGIGIKSLSTEVRQPEKRNSRIKEETRQFIVSKYYYTIKTYTLIPSRKDHGLDSVLKESIGLNISDCPEIAYW